MTLEQRKNNTYFDKKGRQILVGDLLKVFHFRTRKKIHYMYHVVVMEETKDFPVMAARDYNSVNPHYRLCAISDNDQRIYHDAEIVQEWDFESKRKKIKVNQQH